MNGSEIIRMFDAMDGDARGNWMNLWEECADWCWPSNDNINKVRTQGLEKPPQRMIDTCIQANFNFASGFFSHMFSPNTVWAKYRHPNPQLMAIQPVADYFEQVSRVIHNVLIGSNFAQEEFQSLLAMGCFGTNCLSVEEDDKEVVKFRNFVIPNIRVQENYLGVVDVVARELELQPRQAIQLFGKEALMEAGLESIIQDAENSRPTTYKFIHWVGPREDYNKFKKDAANKPIASVYVARQGQAVVKESGFEYNPYKTSRFTTGNSEVYGRGPMSMILAAARRLNIIYRSTILAAEQHVNPQWLVPDDGSVKGLSSRAAAVIKWRANNPNNKPERLAPNGDPGIGLELFRLHEQQIGEMFFNHLFRPLEDYRNMTAYEARERTTTDMMLLAPFTSRYIDEHVSPVMQHVYYICQKKGILPEPPQELAADPNYEIDYVGRLSLVTKSFETLGAVNTIRIVEELGQGAPQLLEALDNVDTDKFFKELWYSESSSMNALKDPEMVQAERQARAEAQAQQQQIDNTPALADAAQKLSGPTDPNSILSQMTGG